MYSAGDITFALRDMDRSAVWPIDTWRSASVKHEKQPIGSIEIEVPRSAWWVSSSGLLDGAGGKGAMFLVECRYRDYDDPLMCAIVQNCRATYAPGRGVDTIALECESLLAWVFRARLLWQDDVAETILQYVGRVDDVVKAIMRDNMVTVTNMPAGYPGGDRIDFGGITVAVAADTGGHATTITFDLDVGRNLQEAVLELCEKWDLRLTADLSGSTITIDVRAAYQANDVGFDQVGYSLSDQFGTVSSIEDGTDYTPIRNTWCVRDGQNRTWIDCDDSVLLYGILEDVHKIQPGGGPASNDMRDYEADHATQDCTPNRSVAIELPGASAWVKAITHFAVADQVSVVCYPIEMYEDLVVVGMELAWDAGGSPRVTVVLGDQRRSYFREAWRRQGPRGGYGMGGRWHLGLTG